MISLPVRARAQDNDFRLVAWYALLALAASFALVASLAVVFRSARDLAGAFLPGLTWW